MLIIAPLVYSLYTIGVFVNPPNRAAPEMQSAALRTTRGIERGARVAIRADGQIVEAFAGESVAAALMAAGIWRLRASPRDSAPRGAFCLMGVCQECTIHVDGRLQQAGLVPVRNRLSVELKGAP